MANKPTPAQQFNILMDALQDDNDFVNKLLSDKKFAKKLADYNNAVKDRKESEDEVKQFIAQNPEVLGEDGELDSHGYTVKTGKRASVSVADDCDLKKVAAEFPTAVNIKPVVSGVKLVHKNPADLNRLRELGVTLDETVTVSVKAHKAA